MDRIESMYFLQESLSQHYSLKHARIISKEEIFDSLQLLFSNKKDFEWAGDLWDAEIGYDEAKESLDQFDFNTLTQIVKTEDNGFAEGLLREIKARFKVQGVVWVIHRYDADPFPSNPHAHQIESNVKLNLSNGEYYRVNKLLGKCSMKELLEIRLRAAKVFKGELPELSV